MTRKSIGEQETQARVAGKLGNSSYGNGADALRGALRAVWEWAECSPEAFVEAARKVTESDEEVRP